MIFVSHDRYLIRQVADRLLIFEEDGVRFFPYDFEEYERTYGREKLQDASEVWKIGGADAQKEDGKEKKPAEKKAANPGKERAKVERRVARLEELMEECDSQKAALNEQLSDPALSSDYVELQKIQSRIDELEEKSGEYLEEWGTLTEFLENL